MAGRGPAPKPKEQRARANAVQRGEWLELPAVTTPPPPMPPAPDDGWHPATEAAWIAWWSDRASTMWEPAQQNAVLELLVLTEKFWRGGVSVANEMRLRQDALGLTEKGKRDLRWRVPNDDDGEEPASRGRTRKRKADDPYAGLAASQREGVAPD